MKESQDEKEEKNKERSLEQKDTKGREQKYNKVKQY